MLKKITLKNKNLRKVKKVRKLSQFYQKLKIRVKVMKMFNSKN